MKKIIIHPLLFALFPVLSLYFNNAELLPFGSVRETIFIAVAATVLLWGMSALLMKNGRKAAFILSVFLMLFFSYGHLVDLGQSLIGLRPEILLVVSCLVFGATLYWTLRSARDFQLMTKLLNIISVALIASMLISQLYRRAYFGQANAKVDQYIETWQQQTSSLASTVDIKGAAGHLPSIYYIILDGYGRADVLDELYHLDNSDFLSALRALGFYVADRSTSNYGQTVLSLSSSLNFTYLTNLADAVGSDNRNALPLVAMLHDNRVFQTLRGLGYQIVTFSSGFSFTEITDADRYFSLPGRLNAFQNELLTTTPIPLFLELTSQTTQYDLHRERILYTLQHLADVTEIGGPTFTFAHIASPHPPFVFEANGDPVPVDRSKPFTINDGDVPIGEREAYVASYRNQLRFISGQVLQTVKDILARSPEPPIIILQGDHGPGSQLDWENILNTNFHERLSIFNAYYFPDQNYAALYPSISPVNTFRIILNQYFGAHYELLEDHSYFSSANLYSFIDVTDQVRSSP